MSLQGHFWKKKKTATIENFTFWLDLNLDCHLENKFLCN